MKKAICTLAAVAGLSSSALAGSAVWLPNPGSGDWNAASNWTQGGPPNGQADVATFAGSAVSSISLSQPTEVDGITFGPEANTTYTITAGALTLNGSGIGNQSGVMQNIVAAPGGRIAFVNSARAAVNTAFTMMGGDAGAGGGFIAFFYNSNAADATFTVNGATHLAWGGTLDFYNSSSAGDATITVNGSAFQNCPPGSVDPCANNPYPQGVLRFAHDSTAGNATLVANGGIGPGDPGAIIFWNSSTGGTARVGVFGNSYLDLSDHDASGLTIGSIEGDGIVYLDRALPDFSPTLTIGSNNLSTTFSGIFVNRIGGPSGSSISKIGTGTLTLSGQQAYFGSTSIHRGRLDLNGSIPRDITVYDGGTLGGSGTAQYVEVRSGGTVVPGGVQPLRVNGEYRQDFLAVLRIDIANADPAASVPLDLAGSASLGGTLEIRFANGFLPVTGQVFKLFHVGGALSGAFAQIIFPDLRSGFQFQTEFKNDYYQITALSDGVPATGFLNISTRMQVGTGDNALIAGFIVASGTGSSPAGASKRVILRAIGPSLMADGMPLPGRLLDPKLELRDGTGALLFVNDNWVQSPQMQEIKDSGIPPIDDNEAAIIATLAPGSYTAVMRGARDTTGVGVVEAYDLIPDASTKLVNISTRGLVDTGDDVMIGGFIADNQAMRVMVRALGPSLAQFGVVNALTDPILELRDLQGTIVAYNDDWQQASQAAIEDTGIAPPDEKESAILTTLSPGLYTAIVRGQSDTTGVGLLEVYELH